MLNGMNSVLRENKVVLGFRLALLFLVAAVSKAAGLANQKLLAFRTGDRHVRLVNADVGFTPARVKRPATGLANERLFAKAAFHHDRKFLCYRKPPQSPTPHGGLFAAH